MYIVDVNYFPGYNGMGDFHEVILDYLQRLAQAPAPPMATTPHTHRLLAEAAGTDEDASLSSDSDVEMAALHGGETPPLTRHRLPLPAATATLAPRRPLMAALSPPQPPSAPVSCDATSCSGTSSPAVG